MTSAPSINPGEYIEEVFNKDCEGFGCADKATEQLDLPCGEYGSTLFFLCKKCSEKIQGFRST